MFSWIGDALASLGSGLASLLSWLFSGLISVVASVIRAAGGIFDLLDALWGFFVGIKDSFLNLFTVFFPWVPAEVVTVVSLGLFASLLAGLVRQVRGK